MDLVVSQVSKKYANVTAINDLSFSVNQGEIFALLGPNGAGKSSIIRMITGFTQPDSGHISLNMDGEQFSATHFICSDGITVFMGARCRRQIIQNGYDHVWQRT